MKKEYTFGVYSRSRKTFQYFSTYIKIKRETKIMILNIEEIFYKSLDI